MSEDPTGGTEPKTFTEEEVQQLIDDRNKALEKKRDELLGEVRGLKDKLRKSDEGYGELQARMAELEQEREAKKQGITSEQLEKMRSEAESNLEKKYGPLRTQLEEAQAEIRQLRLDNVVKGAMAKSGVRGERVDALFRLTADRYDLTEDGKPMLRDEPGLTVEQYISDELVKEYPEFYEGTGSSGGGAPKTVASGSGKVTKIAADDNAAFLANVDKIATGEVTVVQ